ncbi:SAM-dependent methyltransferase [Paraburkholderia unamae]|uniref:Histone methylation protein DOT1 n=1 Tax=Paraburkholderia unamae TaxID=219649 RepID=A0ABX5KQZ8_9BURK|nr:class I SAM-dependent methyltransferase [Paraburkholderia unamae]PVX83221.1 histone methylation protein DOT1 [Paraburkholderia unamae]
MTLLSYVTVALTLLAGLSLVIFAAVTGVPTLSSRGVEASDVIALLKQANLARSAVIIDLGSGWGGLVVAVARAFPEATVEGIEISPFPYLISRLRASGLPNVTLRWGNFHRSNLRSAHAIVCYLMPSVMPAVTNLLDRNLKPGTVVVSNTFLFRERTAFAVRRASRRGLVALYFWPALHWLADDYE